VERPANPGRAPVRERILDTREQAQDGDARNVINAWRTGNAETRVTIGYHPRRGGRYDSREDHSPTSEPPETRVFSREIARRASPSASASPRRSTSTTGIQTPAYGSTTTAWHAIWAGPPPTKSSSATYLPLHLADSAQTWLEHLPASQIHNWDDLVRTIMGNF
jgi:hypothetical protein